MQQPPLEWADEVRASPREYTSTEIGVAHELMRLSEIVDKLPKTEDGVPVVPGETYWAVCQDEPTPAVRTCRYIGHASPHVDYDWEIDDCPWEGANSEFQVFSTKGLAAEAAGGEQGRP